jgi:hypothetical protein
MLGLWQQVQVRARKWLHCPSRGTEHVTPGCPGYQGMG